MLLHILKKDLQRKKTMNIILFLFIIMASMFMASSVNNLIAVSGALDGYIEMAKVPDVFALAVVGKEEDSIEAYLEQKDLVTELQVTNMLNLSNEDIRITKCAKEPERTKYERTNMMSICGVPDNFMKIFDMEGNSFSLEKGEIALPKIEADANHLTAGDELLIKVGEVEKAFTIKTIVKDAVFGTPMLGFKRIYVNEAEFEALGEQRELVTKLYQINTSDLKAFQDDLKKQNFQTIAVVEKAMIKMCYIFDMLMSGILIIISVCLILIAFLILRFTIVFTLQEDYREIGIMKAIGIKDSGIKYIYLIKYLLLSIAGAGVGLLFSFSFERLLLRNVVVNIVMKNTQSHRYVNILCALLVIVVVLIFCYVCTGKLKKITAMEAIRSGSAGERFTKKNVIKLSKRKHIGPPLYMACNDILSNFKRFAVLCIIFCLGTLLILLPLTAINTLKSEEAMRSFSIVPTTAFVDTNNMENYTVEKDIDLLLSDMHKIGEVLRREGLACRVFAETTYSIPCYFDDREEIYSFPIMQSIEQNAFAYDILQGREPIYDNEIIVTEKTAEKMNVSIGDSLYFLMEEGEKEFIITGTFQTLMNMGDGFRIGEACQIPYSYSIGIMAIQIDVTEGISEEAAFDKVVQTFPDYKVQNARDFMDKTIGGILKQMDYLKYLIVAVVLVINCLITLLIMKIFISKEHGEIALLKSIGFCNKAIRTWQAVRILVILFLAITAGILLNVLLAPILIAPTFAMMGATHMKLVINPWEAYLLYPSLLFIVTGAAAYLCSAEVAKVDLKKINNLE